MNWRLSVDIDLFGSNRISQHDADRQMATAAEILRRFDTQPGVILADEVGMGKTFVALAVAASVARATSRERPIVVMIPPGVQRKWPKEWHVFREWCLPANSPLRATDPTVKDGAGFLRLLDDPEETRRDIIFMTHGALTGSLQDPFIRLAIIRQALLRRSRMKPIKASVSRWGGRLFGATLRDPDLVGALLDTPPERWARVLERFRGERPDDPIPDAVCRLLPDMDLKGVRNALMLVPLRSGPQLDARLKDARRELKGIVNDLWKDGLKQMVISSPLLIMDEAHHLKNPWTSLAGLFTNAGTDDDAIGALTGVFDRMLFLTATPFQLGHQELLQVLNRFTAVRWSSSEARDEYSGTLRALSTRLDKTQTAALRLDDAWGRLTPEDVAEVADQPWFYEPELPGLSERARQASLRVLEVDQRMRSAEEALGPWVIRHSRPDRAQRRLQVQGQSIADGGDPSRGLTVEGRSALPFLLAARSQALLRARGLLAHKTARAFFAEGLASSFEAYRMTRLRDEGRDGDDPLVDEEGAQTPEQDVDPELAWYLDELDRALPRGGGLAAFGEHPKIAATVNRALELWRGGEKVIIFCFYIETGRALRRHISAAMQAEFDRRGAQAMGLSLNEVDEVRARLESLGERFFDSDGRLRKVAEREISEVFDKSARQASSNVSPDESLAATEAVMRFLRTPSFLLHHMDISAEDPTEAFVDAMDSPDGSGLSLRAEIRAFADFFHGRSSEERVELIDALGSIQTGAKVAAASLLDEGERSSRVREAVLPNVRLANGTVQRLTRDRLMWAFNTPFFPEILIASSVMAEGVDLHLNCRHVIHHDLDWNPSVLEQRTGRLDRLGSKGETTGKPIVVYEPYIEATQDEKQFRVVKDRERWFNIVMGESLSLDEAATQRIAERIPLPDEVAARLTMRLDLRTRSANAIPPHPAS